MGVETYLRKSSITPDIETEIEAIIHPKNPQEKVVWSRTHGFAELLLREARESLIGLSKAVNDNGIKKPILPSFGGYWEMPQDQQESFRINYAVYCWGIYMRGIERALTEKIFNPMQLAQLHDHPLKGTLVKTWSYALPSKVDFPKMIKLSDEQWQRMVAVSKKDDTKGSFFTDGYYTIPDFGKGLFERSPITLGIIRSEVIPVVSKLTKLDVPPVFLKGFGIKT